jgi:NitT/TauT family transport system permease protein
MPRHIDKLMGPLAVFIVLLGVWQLLYLRVGQGSLASPMSTAVEFAHMLWTPGFWDNVAETFLALFYAFAIGIVAGIALGALLGMHRMSGLVAEPILLNLYSLPKVTLYPLVLLVFGLGLAAKVAFGVMHGMIPVTIFTMNAIRQMKPVYLRVAVTMRLSPWRTVRYVVIPAVLPEIVSGLRLGFSLTLLGVLIGEMFASHHGLGYLLTSAMSLGDTKTIMAVAVFLTASALLGNGVLLMIDNKLNNKKL